MKKSILFFTLAAGFMATTAAVGQPRENSVPVHRPIIEEYTGAWCGWCVRGLVGMELLSQEFGEDFIGVAYHNGDAMQITTSYPNSISGYPSAYIDRTSQVDPYYGFDDTAAGIIDAMNQFAALEAIAGVDVTAQWTSADRTDIAVDVTSYFTTAKQRATYAVEVMLIADDLYGSGSSWNQSNYYSGYTAYSNDPYLRDWVRKGSSVSGIHFNDVLIGTSGVINNSLPSDIEAYTDYNYSYTFTLNNLNNPSLVQNKDNLHIIAIVVDARSKKVINANRCYINDYVNVMPGDVDGDGNINIQDVTALINFLLNGDASMIHTANADVDADGSIKIGDVTTLINLLLSSNN